MSVLPVNRSMEQRTAVMSFHRLSDCVSGRGAEGIGVASGSRSRKVPFIHSFTMVLNCAAVYMNREDISIVRTVVETRPIGVDMEKLEDSSADHPSSSFLIALSPDASCILFLLQASENGIEESAEPECIRHARIAVF